MENTATASGPRPRPEAHAIDRPPPDPDPLPRVKAPRDERDERDERLGTIVRTLCMRAWGWEKVDAKERGAIQICLSIIGAVGIVAHFPVQEVTISHFMPRSGLGHERGKVIAKQVLLAIQAQSHLLAENFPFRYTVDGLLLVATTIPPLLVTPGDSIASRDYCALVYDDDPDLHGDKIRESVDDYHALSSLALIYQVMRQRVRMFAPFPGAISERYWADSYGPSRSVDPLTPPWEPSRHLAAATLSYDLRKSTICMENDDSAAKFAEWLDLLVQILTQVAHRHGGVFDKFTGDGALVHFLEKECEVVYGTKPVEAALACAIDMQYATKIHLDRLRTFLRLDSNLLGGAIGIDVAPSRWSLDHRGNPITVGKGVVGACRLGDKTAAGEIRLTNIAYQALPNDFKRGLDLRSEEFTSKEYSKEMGLVAWTMKTLPLPMGRNPMDFESFCREVYRRHEQRRARDRAKEGTEDF
jgi:class 3 adenylate cyclase